MKSILCYGDSNTWGLIPGTADIITGLAQRYLPHERWTGIVQKMLGDNYLIIEEGLIGRTTRYDDNASGKINRNGLMNLLVTLESHYPLDLVVFMLGTNDIKIQYAQTPKQISEGMRQLVQLVKKSNKGPLGQSPKILIIAPPPVIEVHEEPQKFDQCTIFKSRELAKLYNIVANQEGCEFLDAANFIKSSILDGSHLDKSQLKLLGKAVANQIIKIL